MLYWRIFASRSFVQGFSFPKRTLTRDGDFFKLLFAQPGERYQVMRKIHMIKMISRIALATICLFGIMTSLAAAANDISPFDSVNQSPLVSIFGLPGAGNFSLLEPGRTELGLNAVLSSNYTKNDNAREAIILDGETTRFTVKVRHGLAPRFEIGVKIPYITQSGGVLDGSIESYHGAFGFPQGGRDLAPRNRLLYYYRRDGVDRVRVDASGSGVGDLALTGAWQLYRQGDSEKTAVALNISLKLPTGDSDQLLGSGSTDIALRLTGGSEAKFEFGKWTTYGAAGMLYLTEGKVLPDQQKKLIAFGSLGLGWQTPLTWLALKVQADAHTPFYRDSELKEIGAHSVQLIAGGTLYFSGKTSLDIGVGEDLAVATAPDVSFYLTLRNRF